MSEMEPPPVQTALVVGGGGGIGRATCRALAAQGFAVVVADLDGDAAQSVLRELPGVGHLVVSVDSSDERSVAELFDVVGGALGPIRVLAAIAGGTLVDVRATPLIAQTTLENWIDTETLNGRGSFLLLREFLRSFDKRPVAHGRVILMSSMSGVDPDGTFTGVAYAASKAALVGLARFAAHEVSGKGITVNALAPGIIDTPRVRALATPSQLEALRAAIPIGRIGQPEDVAAAIAFLVTPEAGFITGVTLMIDGGRRFL